MGMQIPNIELDFAAPTTYDHMILCMHNPQIGVIH